MSRLAKPSPLLFFALLLCGCGVAIDSVTVDGSDLGGATTHTVSNNPFDLTLDCSDNANAQITVESGASIAEGSVFDTGSLFDTGDTDDREDMRTFAVTLGVEKEATLTLSCHSELLHQTRELTITME